MYIYIYIGVYIYVMKQERHEVLAAAFIEFVFRIM